MTSNRLPSSFRDPSGYVFKQDGLIFREVRSCYLPHYKMLTSSGLHRKLVESGLIVDHEEVSLTRDPDVCAVLQPTQLPFISYPYEWCFSQLKDAALATLEIQKIAMEHGMSLKDASAYNVQFQNGRPIFIDTLSFEIYTEGEPWVAYRQFCQHFLAPLALMSLCDIRFSQLLRVHVDGLPLDFTSTSLPTKTWLNLGLLSHIHLHARFQAKYAASGETAGKRGLSRMGLMGILDSLTSCVKGLRWRMPKTEWGDYYTFTNYTGNSFEEKKAVIRTFLKQAAPALVFDLGANNGEFSRLSAELGADTIAGDIDPVAVEINYQQCRSEKPCRIVPILLDVMNPSPGLGWGNEERSSLEQRGPADLVMALALVHHLAISGNVPLQHIADYFSRLGRYLIIEFVPKEDSQVQKLLKSREDIFPHYNRDTFENVFASRFTIIQKKALANSTRTVYLMERHA